MSNTKKIVLASGNAGKLCEFKQMLGPAGYEVLPQSLFDVKPADEPFSTFLENALAKARHVSKLTGLPAMADDSGICCDALGGAPGVLSARFAGEHGNDDDNNRKLVSLLKKEQNRHAYYYCVLVYVRYENDPTPVVADGFWHGEVVTEPKGANGFGYDPFFYVPDAGMTAAEMSPADKNAVSHRAKALQALLAKLV